MADFQLIKEQVTIEAAAHMLKLDLRQAGAAFRGPCKACGTGGPRALVVTPSKGLWYCFSAGVGGDVISLWGHIEKCSLADAGRQIADAFGVEERGTSAPSRTSAQVHKSPQADAPPAQQKAETKREVTRSEFDPAAFAQKLEYTDEVAALGISQADAEALGIGFYRGKLYQALRYANGDTAGFSWLANGELKLPQKLLPQTTNIVQLRRA